VEISPLSRGTNFRRGRAPFLAGIRFCRRHRSALSMTDVRSN
jgi:hypothetical protein